MPGFRSELGESQRHRKEQQDMRQEQKQLISMFCVMQLSNLQARVLNPG